MSKPTLHLIMGLPGAGKSTLAQVLETLTGAHRLSSDEFRLQLFIEPCFSQKEHDSLYAILDHNVEHLLEAGYDVIYDANLNRHHHRQEKYDLAQKYNARVRLWYVKTNPKLAKNRRVTEQDSLLLPKGESSEKMFDRIANIIEPPTKDEQHTTVDGTDITEKTIAEKL